jgi:hypothetical protein
MKCRVLIISIILSVLLCQNINSQEAKPEKETTTTHAESDSPDEDRQAYEDYLDFLRGYLQYNTMEELQKYIVDNSDRLKNLMDKTTRYMATLSPDQLTELNDLGLAIAEKMKTFSSSDSQSQEESALGEANDQPEAVKQAYDIYIDFVNAYLACETREEMEKFALNSAETAKWISDNVPGYTPMFTEEQLANIQELSSLLVEKVDRIMSVEYMELKAEITEKDLDSYLDCLENEVDEKILSTDSFYQVSIYPIERLGEICSEKTFGKIEEILENRFNEQQALRLKNIESEYAAKKEEIVKKKNFRQSPDAVIRELDEHYEREVKNISNESLFDIHGDYFQHLYDKFMTDEKSGKLISLTEKQKDDFVSVFFKYNYTRDMLAKDEKYYEVYYFEDVDKLINITESFYNERMKDNEFVLNKVDNTRFQYFEYILENIADDRNLKQFIDADKMDKIIYLSHRYFEVYEYEQRKAINN